MDYLSSSAPLELRELFSNQQHRLNYDLDLFSKAAHLLFDLTKLPPIITVAGTNGKGTTTGMLFHLLSAAGKKVGLFSSPHLCFFHERIQLSYRSLTDLDLVDDLRIIKSQLGPDFYGQLTFFEITTLLAMQVFQGCQWIVLEVGLGGRLDATNLFAPILTAISSIDFDHTKLLGSTLIEIASEKLGITRAQVPLFWGDEGVHPEVDAFVADWCARKFSNPIELKRFGVDFGIKRADLESFAQTRDLHSEARSQFFCGTLTASIPSWVEQGGRARRRNFSLACSMYAWLVENSYVELSLSQVLEKFAQPQIAWPYSALGRLQFLDIENFHGTKPQRFLIDVGHNPAGVREMIAFCRSFLPSRRKAKLF